MEYCRLCQRYWICCNNIIILSSSFHTHEERQPNHNVTIKEYIALYDNHRIIIKFFVVVTITNNCSCFCLISPPPTSSSYVPEPYHLSCTIDFADTSPSSLSYTYFTTIVVFFLPLMIIVSCYVAIARKMIHHNRRINVGHNAGRVLLEIRLLKVLVIGSKASHLLMSLCHSLTYMYKISQGRLWLW